MIRFMRENFHGKTQEVVPEHLQREVDQINDSVLVVLNSLNEAAMYGGIPVPLEAETVMLSLKQIIKFWEKKLALYKEGNLPESVYRTRIELSNMEVLFSGVDFLEAKEIVPSAMISQITEDVKRML